MEDDQGRNFAPRLGVKVVGSALGQINWVHIWPRARLVGGKPLPAIILGLIKNQGLPSVQCSCTGKISETEII